MCCLLSGIRPASLLDDVRLWQGKGALNSRVNEFQGRVTAACSVRILVWCLKYCGKSFGMMLYLF